MGIPFMRAVGAGALLVGGCASVSVFSLEESRELGPRGGEGRQAGAIVEEFKEAFNKGGETLFLSPESHIIEGARMEGTTGTGRRVAGAIRKELSRRKIGGGLRITGQVLAEEGGNGPLRVAIGLGAGGSRLSVRTLIFNDSRSRTRPWLVIWTEGGSGREPGAAFSFVPPPFGPFILPLAGAGAGAALLAHGTKGTGQDAGRTAKVIADAIEWSIKREGTGRGGTPKWRGAVVVPGGATIPITREGRRLSLTRTIYIGD